MVRNKWLTIGLSAVLAGGVIWTLLAWRAGLFIPHDGHWAVAPGEVTQGTSE